jgi:hypothetical protein
MKGKLTNMLEDQLSEKSAIQKYVTLRAQLKHPYSPTANVSSFFADHAQ